MKIAKAFSPAHITGFFHIEDSHKDPLFRGSLGAGFSLRKGVSTEVSLNKASASPASISINGKATESAAVSREVIRLFLENHMQSTRGKLTVRHRIDVPGGSGFGTSGAGALSLSLALNKLFGLGLPLTEAAQIAHIAEINCRTGLGTVIGETRGGFEIREKAGAPGIGSIRQIPFSDGLAALFLVFGPLDTGRYLRDTEVRKRVNNSGKTALKNLELSPTPENFMKLSRKFAESTGLITDRVGDVLQRMDSDGITGSMLMFGEAVFSLIPQEKAQKVLSIYYDYIGKGSIIEDRIDIEGARVINGR